MSSWLLFGVSILFINKNSGCIEEHLEQKQPPSADIDKLAGIYIRSHK